MRVNRRSLLLASGLVATPALSAVASSELRVSGLKVNQLEAPLGLQSQDVRLSWRLICAARNIRQAAYRVLVASSPSNLAAGVGDLWDSGRVVSDHSFDLRYAGAALSARQQVWWRVKVWDADGRVAESESATWEMGLLLPGDWTAQWIAAESPAMRADREAGFYWLTAPPPKRSGTVQVRLGFRLERAADVDLLTIANQTYAAWINGQALDLPSWPPSSFGRRPAMAVTKRLAAGQHVLAMSVNATDVAHCALLVRATYTDGGSARFGDLLARMSTTAPGGWKLPSYDDRAWPLASRAEGSSQPLPGEGAFLLRREFALGEGIKFARLYVTALGAYETYINGTRVGDGLLAPESMDFRKRIRYRVHDVTALLQPGANVMGGLVGDGWYGSYSAPVGRFAWGDPPLRFLAQLEITFADGRVETVVTDPHWQVSRAPITSAEIYNGEDYDARLEQRGWNAPGFSAGLPWRDAVVAKSPTGQLVAASSPPIRAKACLPPKTITRAGNDYVIDFGQNFAGWVRFSAHGAAGSTVRLRYAELLTAEGTVDQSNLRMAQATDSYTFRGDPAGESYEPRLTYHGFRYVQISGLEEAPSPDQVVGVSIHTDLPETGHLRIGNPIVQQLWQNSLWSQRSNFMGIPTDCPQRDERLGWMGDANVFWDAASFNMDTAAFSERWLADVRDAQYANGAYSNVSPNTLPDWGGNEAAPGWADAGVMLPWTVWKRFGNTAIIDQNWDAMVRYLDYVRTHSDDHIWTRGRGADFGDWLSYDGKSPGDPTTPKDLIATALAKHSCDAMAEMAVATGRAGAADDYTTLARDIAAAFVRQFVKADGRVGNESQTSYILALFCGLIPNDIRGAVAKRLDGNISQRGHMLTTGFLGTPASLDVLADNGFNATVYDLLLRTEFPSWGHMIVSGATTTWERWNSDAGDRSMNSFNHYALGAVIGFVYRRIAGIEPLEPGFKNVRVRPVLDPRVAFGGGDFDAITGRITTNWTYDGRTYTLALDLPANTMGEVYFPTSSLSAVREGGRELTARADIRGYGLHEGGVVVQVGSGQYRFACKV